MNISAIPPNLPHKKRLDKTRGIVYAVPKNKKYIPDYRFLEYSHKKIVVPSENYTLDKNILYLPDSDKNVHIVPQNGKLRKHSEINRAIQELINKVPINVYTYSINIVWVPFTEMTNYNIIFHILMHKYWSYVPKH